MCCTLKTMTEEEWTGVDTWLKPTSCLPPPSSNLQITSATEKSLWCVRMCTHAQTCTLTHMYTHSNIHPHRQTHTYTSTAHSQSLKSAAANACCITSAFSPLSQ